MFLKYFNYIVNFLKTTYTTKRYRCIIEFIQTVVFTNVSALLGTISDEVQSHIWAFNNGKCAFCECDSNSTLKMIFLQHLYVKTMWAIRYCMLCIYVAIKGHSRSYIKVMRTFNFLTYQWPGCIVFVCKFEYGKNMNYVVNKF